MVGINLSHTLGVVYWGFVIATVLFGISVVQGYFFFLGSKDSWRLKSFVALLLLLDLATTALSSECLHHYLIINFGNQLALLHMTKPYISEYMITLIIVFLSQLFYAWRVYAVQRKPWAPFFISLLATVSLVAGVALTVQLFAIELQIVNLPEARVVICMSLASALALVCDLVSTTSMCYFLASHPSAQKGKTTPPKMLLFFAVNRGILAAFAQLGHLAMFVAYPSRAYWIPFHLSLSKLHVNTILAMLNSRGTLRARENGTRLEITTEFASACQNSPSPRTPCKRPSSEQAMFELVELPKDRKRPSVFFANVHRPPRGIEDGIGESEVDLGTYEKPSSMLYTGGPEPITFA